MWGQARDYRAKSLPKLIIPTRMGTRQAQARKTARRADHPHAYGDKSGYEGSDIQGEGSSPRVWGQVFMSVNQTLEMGIIPTRVGTSNRMYR